jgi:hypothetical protein
MLWLAAVNAIPKHFVTTLDSSHYAHVIFGEAVHNGTRSFEAKYGTQRRMLVCMLRST